MNLIRTLFYPALGALLGAGSLLAACSSDNGTTSTTTTTTTSTTSGTGGGGTGGGGTGGGGGTAPAAPEFIVKFDATKGELPEGLAIDEAASVAYVGLAATGKIVKVSLPDGAVSDYGSVPAPPMNGGFVLGLILDSSGNLYVGVASFTAQYQGGVYKISKGGGAGVLFAKDAGLVFPNGFAFDKNGTNLYVTDSASGTIFQITPDGTAAPWLTDPLLMSDAASACKSGLGLGANGIALVDGAFYVANTDAATMVKIPINADGSAGKAALLAGPDCATLGGADGLAVDSDGTLALADNGLNTIARVTTAGAVSVLSKDAQYDSPASLAFATLKGQRWLFITNAAFASAMGGGMPRPGLIGLKL